MGKVKVGDKVYFPNEKRPYKVRAREVEHNKRTVSLKPCLEPPIWAGVDFGSLYEMLYRQEPWPLPEEAGRCNRTVGLRDSLDQRRELREVFSVPASVLMPGEIDLQELVGEITEMEEIRMERSLSERKLRLSAKMAEREKATKKAAKKSKKTEE